ncbi:MAG: TetR/AcrR family transcriptional regulator [Candidatus Zixiibacteriota bacterium]
MERAVVERQETILLAAQKLFSQFGLKKVTTDDIAKSAHVSKATIYKHYKNKNEIYSEVVYLEAKELLAGLRAAVSAQNSVADKLRTHLLTRLHKIHSLVNLYNVTQETWSDFWPNLANIGQWFLDEERKIIKDVLDWGIKVGELEISRVDLVSYVTVSTLKSIELPWTLEERGITAEEYVDIMVSIMINGIGNRKHGDINAAV